MHRFDELSGIDLLHLGRLLTEGLPISLVETGIAQGMSRKGAAKRVVAQRPVGAVKEHLQGFELANRSAVTLSGA